MTTLPHQARAAAVADALLQAHKDRKLPSAEAARAADRAAKLAQGLPPATECPTCAASIRVDDGLCNACALAGMLSPSLSYEQGQYHQARRSYEQARDLAFAHCQGVPGAQRIVDEALLHAQWALGSLRETHAEAARQRELEQQWRRNDAAVAAVSRAAAEKWGSR